MSALSGLVTMLAVVAAIVGSLVVIFGGFYLLDKFL